MREDNAEPPRYGEGDHAKHGGGVFATSKQTVQRARLERRSGNLAEVILWRALRTRPGGFKFRRQHPIGSYILDFACLSTRLDVEIDGEAHDRAGRPERDARRDAFLETRGIRTLRIPAREVLAEVQAVVDLIVATCIERQPLHQPRVEPGAGPPPRSGEVLA